MPETSLFRTLVLAGLGAGLVLFAPLAGDARERPTGELVDPTALRVCADPNNLPFSNDKGEGFENKIAELFAEKLGRPLVYTWFPQYRMFIRMTLDLKRCDLIMGLTTGHERVLNTNPYYRTGWVMAYLTESGLTATSLGDPQLKGLKIGLIAGTPPGILAAEHDLLDNIEPYQRLVDTRVYSLGKHMIEDLANGVTDVALVMGPFAAHFGSQQSKPITIVPLVGGVSYAKLDYRITMGVRKREPEWKRVINKLIRENQDEINGILEGYGVPLLEMRGEPEVHPIHLTPSLAGD